ncbi:hypothetical protein P171DRAFT_453691 [Karstenula rhodostoma CBS 690.94]|uniref:Zn(2)-C6 fungal-type domain-containing protein n=1 Tax=Karstenula rhodostoma CBS 690.94 TaxID=1392251 RepID=A0A9P4UC13_9PLEO|nr:hypothetical protein P171DRAFT_453691 [Karstenula rhodostoma CBS 690.94]
MDVRKRKQRAILSCNDCRRRKLKCDRELPCNRCLGGGCPEKCAYSAVEGDDGHERTPKRARTASFLPPQVAATGVSDETGDDRIEELERQLRELKEVVRSLQSKSDGAGGREEVELDGGEEAVVEKEVGLFKGRGVRTFYYGPTSAITVVAHFPDLGPFMKQVFIGSTLQKLRQDSKLQEDRARARQAANRMLTVPNLRSLLPGREMVDSVVKTYFATFETTYRILHAPTFWTAYAGYWDGAHELNSDMDATVLAILACTLCTSTHETPRYNADGSTFRSQAVVWIKACEAWLRGQSNKHRRLASVQVMLLRLLALSITCLKTKEYYQEVQGVMAFMVSSGMHRDSGILGSRCSVFEAEMSRRLWATTMELEMQASLDKGTPSTLSSLQYDCAAPRNIQDFDIHPDTTSLPDSHPWHTFTDTSYLHISVRSLPLRATLCAIHNSLHARPSATATFQSEQDIQSALTTLPHWTDSRALIASTLLDLQLRQFLLFLHTHIILHTPTPSRPSPAYTHATTTTLATAETIITLHTTLLTTAIHTLTLLRLDYLRAALLIAHIAYHAPFPSFTSRLARVVYDATAAPALRLLEERSMRPGRGNHHYCLTHTPIQPPQHNQTRTLISPGNLTHMPPPASTTVLYMSAPVRHGFSTLMPSWPATCRRYPVQISMLFLKMLPPQSAQSRARAAGAVAARRRRRVLWGRMLGSARWAKNQPT